MAPSAAITNQPSAVLGAKKIAVRCTTFAQPVRAMSTELRELEYDFCVIGAGPGGWAGAVRPFPFPLLLSILPFLHPIVRWFLTRLLAALPFPPPTQGSMQSLKKTWI